VNVEIIKLKNEIKTRKWFSIGAIPSFEKPCQ
jgi:hypothetical protein